MFGKNKLLIIVFSSVVAAMVLVFIFSPPNEADKIYAHIHIHRVPVGGMSREEAEAVLMERFQTGLETQTVQYINNEEIVAAFTFADFGAKLDFSELIDAAFEYSPSLPVRISRWIGRPYEINAPTRHAFDSDRMQDILNQLSSKFDIPPENASFAKTNGQIEVQPETTGYGVDLEAAALATQKILDSHQSGVIKLIIKTVQPKYTAADFEFPKSILGAFETPVADIGGSRGRNVQLAASRVNNSVLFPGQVFSAGATIDSNNPSSGYEIAIILVRGNPVEDIGGGVCQVVTTLYNAALLAELEVVQRHNHSARVSYADLGFDATVAGDYFDLKLKNNTEHPLLITSWIAEENLHVEIVGYDNRPTERSIRFIANKTEISTPEPYREYVDATIPRGERLITLESQLGYRVEVHKIVYMNLQEVERVKINTSEYRPLQGIIAIGAG